MNMKKRMNGICRVLVAALGPLFVAGTAVAQSTSTITYQGRLTENGALVADGDYPMTFRLWDAEVGGTLIEEMVVLSVGVQKGVFTALVPVTSASFNEADRWWSVEFNGTELSPRQLSTATPFAVRSSGFAGRLATFAGTNLAFNFIDTLDPQAATGAMWSLETAFAPGNFGLVRYNNDSPEITRSVVITPEGTVGIGRPNPNPIYKLHVEGDTLARRHHFSEGLFFHAEPDIYNIHMENGVMAIEGFSLCFRAQGQDVANMSTSGTHFFKGVSVPVMEIRGADLAEGFEVSPAHGKAETIEPAPGMVVCIDPDNAGELVVSTGPYDKRVAGVISGANGLDVGIVLGKGHDDPLINGEHPVAMTGRVWVYCDASEHPIAPGDRLTTSDVPGHAMAVHDDDLAPGSVIGKAMTDLADGRGMVLVLVNLQ